MLKNMFKKVIKKVNNGICPIYLTENVIIGLTITL